MQFGRRELGFTGYLFTGSGEKAAAHLLQELINPVDQPALSAPNGDYALLGLDEEAVLPQAFVGLNKIQCRAAQGNLRVLNRAAHNFEYRRAHQIQIIPQFLGCVQLLGRGILGKNDFRLSGPVRSQKLRHGVPSFLLSILRSAGLAAMEMCKIRMLFHFSAISSIISHLEWTNNR